MKGENLEYYEMLLLIGVKAVRNGCFVTQILRKGLTDNQTRLKSDESPVTVADLAVQCVIAKSICESGIPVTSILAEEDIEEAPNAFLSECVSKLNELSNVPSDWYRNWTTTEAIDLFKQTRVTDEALETTGQVPSYWVLDPIDGTKGYIDPTLKDQYAIALAYVENGEPVLGILGCPNLPPPYYKKVRKPGCIAYATRYGGAKMILCQAEAAADQEDPNSYYALDTAFNIATSTPQDHASIQIAESADANHSDHSLSSRARKMLGIQVPPYRISSQAKYAAVASGGCHTILRFPKKGYQEYVWDHCAGALIVEAAGGCVSHANGQPLDCRRKRRFNNTSGIVVSSTRELHEKTLEIIKQIRFERGELTVENTEKKMAN